MRSSDDLCGQLLAFGLTHAFICQVVMHNLRLGKLPIITWLLIDYYQAIENEKKAAS